MTLSKATFYTVIMIVLMIASVSCSKKQATEAVETPISQNSQQESQNSQLNTEEPAPVVQAEVNTPPKAEKKGKKQTNDLISGKPVNRSVYKDYNGFRIYFCCAASRDQFSEKPDFYMEKAKKEGIILEATK